MSNQYRNFMGYLWYLKEDNVYTVGINEEGLQDLTEIAAIELPREGEEIEAEVVFGSVEGDDGSLDLYSPVTGKVFEINTAVVEDPSLLQDDPYDAWILKIESDEDPDEEEDEEDEDEDEEEEEEEEE